MNVPPSGARQGGLPSLPVVPVSVPGLSTCLEETRLVCDGGPVAPTVSVIDAVRLAEHALVRAQSVLLCPPVPTTPLAALVAAAVHVADISDAYRARREAVGSRRRVAVVTTDFRLRGLYRGIAVRHRGGGAAPIRDVFPAAAIGAGGGINVLGDGNRGWSTVFVDRVADVSRIAPVDLVVLDLPCVDAARAASLGVPVVAVSRDPADPAATEMAAQWPAFAWEPPDPLQVEVARIRADRICENAGLFWSDVGPLTRAGSSRLGAEISREAFSLFHDLLGAALPLHVLDAHSTAPVAARLAGLRRAARLADGELGELYIPMVEAELSALADAVASEGAKADVLRRLLAEALDDRRDVLLLARTAALARAYTGHLGELGFGRVRVASLATAAAEPPADVAVLTGMAPSWARWAYRSRNVGALQVLAYVGSSGFDEAERVAASARAQVATAAALSSPEYRARSWAQLNGLPVEAAPPGIAGKGAPDPVVAQEAPPPEAPPGLWDSGRWTVDVEPAPWTLTSRDRAIDKVVGGLRVALNDGTWALLAAGDTVARWREASFQLDHVLASSLQPGDKLVFLDEDAHKTLLGKVLEVADSVPELAVAGAWLGVWRQALLRGYTDAGGYSQLARRINAVRAGEDRPPLDTVTIRFWVTGHTLGPEDPGDVRRVAVATGDEVLLHGHEHVYRAMRTLRGAHVQLGRRLADLSRRLGPLAGSGAVSADELLDARSGLTAADFETAVTVSTITAIDPVGSVPAILTGRRRDREEIS